MSNSFGDDRVGWTSEPPDAYGMSAFDHSMLMNPVPHLEMDLKIESCNGMDLHGYQGQPRNWNRHDFTSTGSHLNAITAVPNQLSANRWTNQQQTDFPNPNTVQMCSNTYLATNLWDIGNSTDIAQPPNPLPDQQLLATSSMPWKGKIPVPEHDQNAQSLYHAPPMLSTTSYPLSGSHSMVWGHVTTTMNAAFCSILDQTAPVEHAASPEDAENPNPAATLLISYESTTFSTKSAGEDEGSELVCFGMVGPPLPLGRL
ncbi:hypothetical protein V8F33_001982 [Rhypophila sp. PSN 637]